MVKPPHSLQEASYHDISALLSTEKPELPPAFEYPSLPNSAIHVCDRQLDFSLIRQLRHVYRVRPELFAFTLYSAVPVADIIRSFYAHMNEETPVLTYINTKSDKKSPAKDHMAREADRLRNLGSAGVRVCIVDQYVNSGNTLIRAKSVLQESGASNINIIAGNWYQHAYRDEVSPERMTSDIHADFMSEIGKNLADHL